MEFGSESERLKYKRQMEDSVQLGVSPEVPSGYGLPRRDDAAVNMQQHHPSGWKYIP